jgi:hypothetical protein
MLLLSLPASIRNRVCGYYPSLLRFAGQQLCTFIARLLGARLTVMLVLLVLLHLALLLLAGCCWCVPAGGPVPHWPAAHQAHSRHQQRQKVQQQSCHGTAALPLQPNHYDTAAAVQAAAAAAAAPAHRLTTAGTALLLTAYQQPQCLLLPGAALALWQDHLCHQLLLFLLHAACAP